MTITAKKVAEKIPAYLHHKLTLAQLVDWAERAMMDGTFEAGRHDQVRNAVARLGLADVRAFGLTWDDCEQFLEQLGFAARVEIVAMQGRSSPVLREKPGKKYGK